MIQKAAPAWGQMAGRNLPILYWRHGQPTQNFGDFLTEFFLDRLFLPYGIKAKAFHIIGSCLDDIFFDEPLKEGDVNAPKKYEARRVVFWGCGLRTPGGLSEENRERSEILAVRGPLTRSALRLGESIPMGDPALLLPALHKPADSTNASTVCVPHFSDHRSDAELMSLSGCSVVLRPNIPNRLESLIRFIDCVATSKFVMASSLHAAIVAAAYGRPFAFWDSGMVDLPFKWSDFAELVSIPCTFAKSLKDGAEIYHSDIAPNYRPPSLWPLVAASPFIVRTDALLKILQHELQHEFKSACKNGNGSALAQKVEDLVRFRTGKKRFYDYSGRIAGVGVRSENVRLKEQLAAQELEYTTQHAAQEQEYTTQLAAQEQACKGIETALAKLKKQSASREFDIQRINNELAIQHDENVSLGEQLLARSHELARMKAEQSELLNKIAIQSAGSTRLEQQLTTTSQELQIIKQTFLWRSLYAIRAKQKKIRSLANQIFKHLNYSFFKHSPAHIFSQLVRARQLLKTASIIRDTGIFDRAWYLMQNPDAASAGVNPLFHYIRHGGFEGRDPNPLFSSDWYLRKNPDVAASGVNPLLHYILHGGFEGRDPNPLFDSDWYMVKYPDVKESKINPLVHYMHHGALEGRDPSPHFDSDWYLQRYPDVAKSGMNPLAHYLCYGEIENRQPKPAPAGSYEIVQESAKTSDNLKILMIDSIYPRADRDSGSVDALNYIKIFQDFGYQVIFAADVEFQGNHIYRQKLEEGGVICLHPPEYESIESFIQNEGGRLAAAFLSRIYCGGRFYETMRTSNPSAKIIFNTVDLHGIREEREARLKQDLRGVNLAERTAERERFLARQCDATIVVSKYESEWFDEEAPGARIYHIPLMRDCPGRGNEFEQREGICFVGGFSHQPNVDAVLYFLDRIWPKILEQLPQCKFYIIGSDIPEDLSARTKPNVEVVGHAPNLREWLEKMRLSVAPLRYGAGAKGKVVSSLSNGLPCVATAVAAEGINLEDGRQLAIESAPEEFANRVVKIYNDKELWLRLSNEGHRFCSKELSFEAGRERVASLLRAIQLPMRRN